MKKQPQQPPQNTPLATPVLPTEKPLDITGGVTSITEARFIYPCGPQMVESARNSDKQTVARDLIGIVVATPDITWCVPWQNVKWWRP